ncbi:MAG: HD domain-containing protein [Tyzzerella sp.]|nr:HD domain-containing protein [Tyzzerella sp.]
MNRAELFAFIKSDSMKKLVPASDIKTKEIMDIHNGVEYNIGFTYDELLTVFPEAVAKNLYYNNGFDKAFYYDKEKLILFPVHLYGKQALKPYDEFGKEIIERASAIEEAMSESDFYPSLMVLNDKMRMEMLNLLIEKDMIKDGYSLFKGFYQTSDYGCSELTLDTVRKLKAMKTDEHQKETEEYLKNFPDKITVYRGEGDRSAKWQNAISWTTDINIANFFASRMVGRNAKIHIAQVDKKDIIDYFENESECIILPESIRIVDRIHIKGLDYIEDMLPKVMGYYHDYRDLITDYAEFNMEGDHGEIHSARVLLNCLLIAKEMKLTSHETDVLAIASVFHDTMRDNDGDDTKHGEASAKYYAQFAKEHPALVNHEKVIEQIIKYHCLPDEIGRSEINKRYLKLFDVFKDADALDRVRFGIRDLDVNQLRTPEAKSMTMVADILRQELKLPEQTLGQGMEMT